MKEEHVWNVWSDDLDIPLKNLLFLSLQILQKTVVVAKSERTLSLFTINLHLQEDQNKSGRLRQLRKI